MSEPPASALLPGAVQLLRGQVRYQLLLLVRTQRAAFAGVLFPLGLLVLRGDGHPGRNLVAGLTVLGALSTGFLTHAAGLLTARQDGVLRRWRASPLPPWAFFTGRIAATALLATAGAAVTVGVAAVAYHAGPTAAGAVSLLATLVVGTLAWATLGTAATAFVPTAESAQPLLALAFYPLLLLSGALGAAAGQPGWLAGLLRWLPAEPMIDAAGRAFGAGAGPLPPAHDLAVLGCWAAAGLAASLATFRWHPR